jgi:hypothetical protein
LIKNIYDKNKIMGEEDRRKGKAGQQKYRHQKPYQLVDDDSQFRVPQRVAEDKKVSHKQVFGQQSKNKPTMGKVKPTKPPSSNKKKTQRRKSSRKKK